MIKRLIIVSSVVAGLVGTIGIAKATEADRPPRVQENECDVIKEGGRPGEHEREFWQTWRCADGYRFTLVWGESSLLNMIWNLPDKPDPPEDDS